MAKRIVVDHLWSTSSHHVAPTLLEFGTILCGDELIASQVQQSLYTCIFHTKLVKWYSRIRDIPLSLLRKQVSWRVFGKARNEGRTGLNTFMTKYISGNTATWKVMRMKKKIRHSNCP